MVRESMRLRRADTGAALRPTTVGQEFNSALRSDYMYTPPPISAEETFLISEAIEYNAVRLTFVPADVIASNPYSTYGAPSAYVIVRSPGGYPTTSLDGYEVARFDFTALAEVTNKALTTNVATLTTRVAHGFVAGQSVVVSINDAVFDGTFTIASTPTSTTFTYAKTNANVGSTAVSPGRAYIYGQHTPIPTDGRALVTDENLISGQFYYYGLFARYNYQGNVYWLRIAVSEVLVPMNFGYRTKLWNFIPEYYRRLDDENKGSAQEGVLRRYMNALGYEVDVQRTWVLTVGDLWDTKRVNSRLLPYLSGVLGLTPESVVGDKRIRNLLNNVMYLRKLRGTKDGIEGWLSAATGYKTIAYVGKNLFLSNDDTEMRSGSGLWESGAGNVTQLRITSAGEAGGPASGEFYLRHTNYAGGTSTPLLRYGPSTFDRTKAIPVTAGNSYRLSFYAKHSEASKSTIPKFDWYKADGTFISTTTDTTINLAAAGAWSGILATNWVTAPALSAYCIPSLTGGQTMAANATLAYWKLMFVDRSWTPAGIPTQNGVDPTTTYESARKVFVNLYPQRTNFAINSDFRHGSAGWFTTDPATYELLPTAYLSYATLLSSTEADYADLLSGYDSMTTQTSIAFDTTNSWLTVDTAATVAPWLTQVSSAFFPVIQRVPYSARLQAMSAAGNGTNLLLRMKWYTDDTAGAEIAGSSVSSSFFALNTSTWTDCTIANCIPPANAVFGRLIIETSNLSNDHTDRIRKVLIEDAPVPGTYFDGSFTDGAFGDYRFVGASPTPWTTFSAYHMNFNAILNGVSSSGRATSLAATLVPPDRDVGLNTILNGLLA